MNQSLNKLRINMVGGSGFINDKRCIASKIICTTCGHTSKYIDWVTDGSANVSMHIDEMITRPVNRSKRNFAWIYEFSVIQPGIINWAATNMRTLENNFDMIFTHDKRLLGLSPKVKLARCNSGPWIINPAIYPKSKMISMIASTKVMCQAHAYRQTIAEKYKSQIDLFGSGRDSFIETKEQGLNDYYFSIAMENSDIPDEWSEKITDCFATGTIPIFWGISNIGDFWNENGIIRLTDNFRVEDLSKDLYFSKMDFIKDNLNRVFNMPTAEDYLFEEYLNYLL